MPGSRGFLGGAAYRNRTDDLRITRRIRVVHSCPLHGSCPAHRDSRSTQVRGRPGLLLADPLARSPKRSFGGPTGRPLDQATGPPGRDQGWRRCPKTKYEIGTTPAELTSAMAAAHIHFRPRIWLAGRRRMSMSAATRRAPSAAAAVTSNTRVRLLRSLHRCLAAETCSSLRSSASCAAICSSASSSCRRTSAGRSSS